MTYAFGCNVAVARRIAGDLESGVVVTVLCDDISKYLSESSWEEER